jgi:serine/threonine-protein kinase
MAPAEPVRRAPPPAAAAVQPVTVITSPSGATAMLDGRTDAVCTTPCTLDALAGRHSITLKLAGHQTEQREFSVGSGPLELPIVVLRAPSGVLMLTSTPSGAAVLVNGRQTGKTTPAQLSLPPGNYRITVERDGLQTTQNVEVHGGMSYLKISFGQ